MKNIYEPPLSARIQCLLFEGLEKMDENFLRLSAIDSGTLELHLDSSGIVRSARHEGFEGLNRGSMDILCGILVDRPLQEGVEHGCIRLEAIIRGTNPRPVTGLLTPENASPLFLLPLRLLREVYAQFQKHHKTKRNVWRDPIPKDWQNLSDQERIYKSQLALNSASISLGLQSDVRVVEVKNLTRLVLSFSQNPDFPDFSRAMIRVERCLRENLTMEIELQLESIEDRNRRTQRTGRE